MEYEVQSPYAIEAAPSERAAFIRSTYAHLAGAILAFVALEAVLLNMFSPEQIFGVLRSIPYSMLLVFGAFIVAGWVAESWARSETSVAVQYLGRDCTSSPRH
jgi:hypothetical protein